MIGLADGGAHRVGRAAMGAGERFGRTVRIAGAALLGCAHDAGLDTTGRLPGLAGEVARVLRDPLLRLPGPHVRDDPGADRAGYLRRPDRGRQCACRAAARVAPGDLHGGVDPADHRRDRRRPVRDDLVLHPRLYPAVYRLSAADLVLAPEQLRVRAQLVLDGARRRADRLLGVPVGPAASGSPRAWSTPPSRP